MITESQTEVALTADDLELLFPLKKGNEFVLFVGAGINYPFVPLWGQICKDLLEIALPFCVNPKSTNTGRIKKWLIESYDVYNLPSLVKCLIGDDYKDLLRNIIYKNYKAPYQTFEPHEEAKEKDQTTLYWIVKLCQLPQLKAVVTYNYDTLLEDALRYKEGGRDFVSIVGNRETVSNMPNPPKEKSGFTVLPIYHVHGFLPQKNDINFPFDSDIVLTTDEYIDSMRRHDSWNNSTQLHFLNNYLSVFVGASLRDINMLRHLFSAKERNHAHLSLRLKKKSLSSDKTNGANTHAQDLQSFDHLEKGFLNQYNIKAIYSDSIPEILNEIDNLIRNHSSP